MRAPLDDVRILAVEQFAAGPWGTVQLAELGAEVWKIEDPRTGGDVARYVPPFQDGEDSLFFETFSHNKRSISLDLKHAHARVVLEDLVRASDGVYSNLRGDGPRKLRIRYEDLREINERIVCCSLSGFGMTGPRAIEGGYDNIMQGNAGWMSMTGDPDGPPTKSGLSVVDLAAGYVAALALMCGLWRARRDGVGCDCDVSLFETAMSMNMYVSTWALSRDYAAARTPDSSHLSIVPFQNFQTADGWVVIAAAKDKFFHALAEVVGLAWMATDERFATMAARLRNREECVQLLAARLRRGGTRQWVEQLQQAGVPCGPVNDVTAACADAQAVARELVAETEHERLGTVRQIRSAVRVDGRVEQLAVAPRRGADTRSVLVGRCGYSDEQVDELRDAGVFGPLEV